MSRWLVKRRWPESVVGIFPSRVLADFDAQCRNENYQTDDYYVEPWDDAKAATWPVRGSQP